MITKLIQMRMLAGLLLACTAVLPAQASELSNSKQALNQALALEHSGQEDKAYEILNLISQETDEFIPALVELQKIHYRTENWGRFFGYTLFYREKVLRDKSLWNRTFNARLFSLEALALTRHCMWKESAEVLDYGIHIAKSLDRSNPTSQLTPPHSASNSKSLGELERALSFLGPLQAYQNIQQGARSNGIPHGIFKDHRYWPIDSKWLDRIHHPRVLNFKIESRCSK